MPLSFISRFRRALARKIHPSGFARMYASARPNRLNGGFGSNDSSEDSELTSSLRNLRARSRQLVRDSAFAGNAKRIIVNNVVGTGIKLQALVINQRGRLQDDVNDSIEEAFRKWSCEENCHTGGVLHFSDLERLLMGQVFEAGEIFVRIHRSKFGKSEVPIALEIIEPERIVDNYSLPSTSMSSTVQVRMGIETDEFRRPLAYWVRDLHPGDVRVSLTNSPRAARIPAADMLHLKLTDRWPQTRGVPWMHAVVGKLGDMNGYSEAEIIAARAGANYIGTIETPEDPDSLGEGQTDGTFQESLEPGTWKILQPGEKATLLSPNRPNSALDPFMRFMLREVAAGAGVSYESLGRDYSQSNYSSSRLALLDDRDVWKALQQWFIRSFRTRLHAEWMTAAVLAGAVKKVPVMAYGQDINHYQAAIFRPRGWSWVDPTKEVAAFKDAVKAGFTTVAAVIAQTGGGDDLEDTMVARKSELEYMRENDLHFDTSPEVYVPTETKGVLVVDPETGSAEVVEQPAPAAPGDPTAIAKDTPKASGTPEKEPPEDEDKMVASLHHVRQLRKQRHA